MMTDKMRLESKPHFLIRFSVLWFERCRKLFTPEPIEWRLFRRKLVFIALAVTAIYYAEREIVVTTSPSITDRIFWRTESLPQRGDYVMFTLVHPLLHNKPVRLTKRLVCWQGDVLRVDGLDYYCNGVYIGTAKTKGFLGQKLPLFIFDGSIPPGKAFAAGTHVDSFDSRYWGFVEVADTERVVPLLGWK